MAKDNVHVNSTKQRLEHLISGFYFEFTAFNRTDKYAPVDVLTLCVAYTGVSKYHSCI